MFPSLAQNAGLGSSSYQAAGEQQSGERGPTPPDRRNAGKTISCLSCRQRKMKCDRIKPKCATCSRLGLRCEFPVRKRPPSTQRRTLKTLEARLASLETQLVSDPKTADSPKPVDPNLGVDRNEFGMGMDLGTNIPVPSQPSSNPQISNLDLQSGDRSGPKNASFTQDLVELGLQESLPPQELMDELHRIYFEKVHPTLPMIHKTRYYASLQKGPQARPPACLRYAIWATVASFQEKNARFEDIFYKRARKYIEAAEMKGHGETFVTLYHAQTWCLIAMFEAKKTYFSRSWMSVGRAICLVQKLGLYGLDVDSVKAKNGRLTEQKWIELEERRRTFWTAFYGDRWASTLTGWPMLMDEDKIMTNLPASEDSFEKGVAQDTISLQEACTPGGAKNISAFGGVILSSALYGHIHQHLHRPCMDEHPEDLLNGKFWVRHRVLDNVLSNTFMFLPDHLRLPTGLGNMNIVFIHISLHTLVIFMHQAAVKNAVTHQIDASTNTTTRGQERCLMAAEEITNILRVISYGEAADMNSWIGYCLYAAATVFIKDQKSAHPHRHGLANLEFLMATMHAIGIRQSIASYFAVQLELEAQTAGLAARLHTVGNKTPLDSG